MEYARSAGFLAAIVGEGRMMHEVTGADVDRFIASRLADERSANTAAKHVRNIRRLFRWALARGHVERDPTTEATALPKTSARVRPTVTERQLAALYRALDTEDRRLAFSIAITAGLDRDVISRLTSENIDADGAAFIFKRPKTGTVLLVPIHRDLLPEILARLDRIPQGVRCCRVLLGKGQNAIGGSGRRSPPGCRGFGSATCDRSRYRARSSRRRPARPCWGTRRR
jgi:hypothetical protein